MGTSSLASSCHGEMYFLCLKKSLYISQEETRKWLKIEEWLLWITNPEAQGEDSLGKWMLGVPSKDTKTEVGEELVVVVALLLL